MSGMPWEIVIFFLTRVSGVDTLTRAETPHYGRSGTWWNFQTFFNFFKPAPNSRRLHTMMSGTPWEIVIFFHTRVSGVDTHTRADDGRRRSSDGSILDSGDISRYTKRSVENQWKTARNAYFTEKYCQITQQLLLLCKFSQILCEINYYYYCYYFASFHKFYVKSITIAINLQVFTNFMWNQLLLLLLLLCKFSQILCQINTTKSFTNQFCGF